MTDDQASALAASALGAIGDHAAVSCRPIPGGWRCWARGDSTSAPTMGGRDVVVREDDGAIGYVPVAFSDEMAAARLALIGER